MNLIETRNTLREWFRARQAAVAEIASLPLVVPNQGKEFGTEMVWLRLSIRTGGADVTGVGSALKRRTRVGRIYIEVFGPTAMGDGQVGEIATVVEQIWRDATDAAASPHQHIYIDEPHSYERSEKDRYCMVVSVPFRADIFS